MGLEERLPDEGFITTTLEYAVNWGRKYSIFPLTFGLACCAIEQITHIARGRLAAKLRICRMQRVL